MNEKLIQLLIRHEGLKKKPYLDTVGKWTVAVGRNLSDVGLSEEECIYLLKNDLAKWQVQLAIRFPWYSALSDGRQAVLIDMVHNLGMAGFLEFRKLIDAVESGHFEVAANEMVESKWARQVGQRAVDLYHMMMTGDFTA